MDQKIVEMDIYLATISALAKQHTWLNSTWLQMPPSSLAGSIW